MAFERQLHRNVLPITVAKADRFTNEKQKVLKQKRTVLVV